jgi:hypothetical protein
MTRIQTHILVEMSGGRSEDVPSRTSWMRIARSDSGQASVDREARQSRETSGLRMAPKTQITE